MKRHYTVVSADAPLDLVPVSDPRHPTNTGDELALIVGNRAAQGFAITGDLEELDTLAHQITTLVAARREPRD